MSKFGIKRRAYTCYHQLYSRTINIITGDKTHNPFVNYLKFIVIICFPSLDTKAPKHVKILK